MPDQEGNSADDWIEYQDNEIQDAADDFAERSNHLQSDKVVPGVLDGQYINRHDNARMKAYLQGYADALSYASQRVERIDNLVKYAVDGDE